jgi:hypothetical protein
MGVDASNALSKAGLHMDRNARSRQHQQRNTIERRARSVAAMEFFNVLASPAMVERMDR